MTDETEYTFFVGEPMTIDEYLEKRRLRKAEQESLSVTPAEDDEVEFVQPSVPGRAARLVPAEERERMPESGGTPVQSDCAICPTSDLLPTEQTQAGG